jgi:hypothetical protein
VARRDWNLTALLVMVACTAFALATMQPGGDYFFDSGSIDALVRGDLGGFFDEQPLMGPLTLLLRAPFVALVFHSDLTTVFMIGVIPCYAALLALALVLWRAMDGRSRFERVAVAAVCAGSPIAVRAVNWGHPEEFVCTALAIGAVLAASRDRPVWAGVLLGGAYASKQWALVAAAPVLVALPSRHRTFVATAAGVGAAFTLPMLLGDPDRFWLITRAAGSADPSTVLGLRHGAFPAGRVAPHALWMPLGSPGVVEGSRYLFMDPTLARLAHPLILLSGLPLAWTARRRAGGPVARLDALRLLALVFLLRAVLDPNNLDYYHVPLLAALAAMAAYGGPGELRAALLAGAGLGLAFAQPAQALSDLVEHAWLQWLAYMVVALPLALWLALRLFAPATSRAAVEVRIPRASTSSM